VSGGRDLVLAMHAHCVSVAIPRELAVLRASDSNGPLRALIECHLLVRLVLVRTHGVFLDR